MGFYTGFEHKSIYKIGGSMALKKKTYAEEKGENLQILLDVIKSRKRYDDQRMAKMAGMKLSTYRLRKQDPGSMRLRELWAILKVAGITDDEKNNVI